MAASSRIYKDSANVVRVKSLRDAITGTYANSAVITYDLKCGGSTLITGTTFTLETGSTTGDYYAAIPYDTALTDGKMCTIEVTVLTPVRQFFKIRRLVGYEEL